MHETQVQNDILMGVNTITIDCVESAMKLFTRLYLSVCLCLTLFLNI